MKSTLKCVQQITEASKIAIVVHQNADTDALASGIALRRVIADNFAQKKCIDIFTDTNEFNKKDEDLIANENINIQTYKRYDLVITLDTPSRQRLGKFDEIVFKKSKDSLNIDHHITNVHFAKNNIVVLNSSSACEVIYLLFINVLKYQCSIQTKNVLYSGIITDTNNLTQNIGPKTFAIVDEIVKNSIQEGIDAEKVRNHYFKSNTKERNGLLAKALGSLSYSDNGKIAMMKITKQDFSETHTSQADTLGIVDFAINTEGVEVGIIFIKQEDNTYYVSLRSKNENVNVGEIAKEMGGGGHAKVAAFQSKPEQNLTDMKAKITSLCNQQFAKLNDKNNENISEIFAETEKNKDEVEKEMIL